MRSQLSNLELSFPLPSDTAEKVDFTDRDFRILVLAGLSYLAEKADSAAAPVTNPSGYGLDTTTGATTTIPAGLSKVQILLSADFTGTVKVGTGSAFTVAGATDYSIPVETKTGSLLPAIVVTRSAGSFRAYGL